MTDAMHRFVRVEFNHFKAFKTFSLDLKHFNILVGPNNAGKSTILVAFRILASALRKASSKKPTIVTGPKGKAHGYEVDLAAISVAEENIFYNYDDSSAASVKFHLSNKSSLELFFPERGVCNLLADTGGRPAMTPSAFRGHFRCPIGFVPILGPVEHYEPLYEKEAARNALFNYRAARNFRNIWHHYPEHFDEFRAALQSSWPGMDIEPPQVDMSFGKARLNMFCPEERIPRELFWAGFGFQVWCQMLTHLIQWRDSAIFLIDEPDIYLHSELQRQLIAYLRNLGPDILIATHSTEMVMEAEADDIVVISKQRRAGRRIRDPSQLEEVFSILGSNTNPILTQLAKTRRALFVEGKDFQILGKLARRAGLDAIANRRDFAVVPVEGFSPDRIRSLKAGMETTLGTKIMAAAILDGDYRSEEERKAIAEECSADCQFVVIHDCKEIENFLLVPSALDRAAAKRLHESAKRSGKKVTYEASAEQFLSEYCNGKKAYVQSQLLSERRRFERSRASTKHESDINEIVLKEFDLHWQNLDERLRCIPGKDAFSAVNKALQDKYGISLTPTAVLDAMLVGEMSRDVVALLEMLKQFSSAKP
ncbi:MAG: AAA family ATPase [Hyphomonadaceae bacterium]|nr:AAA family ATPase [Hyphomonadaceae bacterium]